MRIISKDYLSKMDINVRILNKVSKLTKPILELYCDNDEMEPFTTLTIPEPIEVYVSDYTCYDLVLPKTLRVLDLDYWGNISMRFNMPPNIEDIIIRNTNIEGKTLMELFPSACNRYRYANCSLENEPIAALVSRLYIKYFGYKYFHFKKNVVNYRIHSNIIEEIREYEENVVKAKENNNRIKEELIQAVYHPDRVEKGINKYGMEFIDTL